MLLGTCDLSEARRAAGRGSKAQRAEGAKGMKGAEPALPLAAEGAGHSSGWWLKEGSPQSMVWHLESKLASQQMLYSSNLNEMKVLMQGEAPCFPKICFSTGKRIVQCCHFPFPLGMGPAQ